MMKDDFKYLPEKYRGEYQQVEYIRNNRGYINTNLTPTNNDIISATFRTTRDVWCPIILSEIGAKKISYYPRGNNIYYGAFGGSHSWTPYVGTSCPYNHWSHFKLSQDGLYVNGVEQAIVISTIDLFFPYKVFATGDNIDFIDLKNLKIKKDSQLIIDYIPVIRLSDNVAGMLNIAPYAYLVDGEDIFHRSETSSDFIAGGVITLPKLSPNYFMQKKAAMIRSKKQTTTK